MPASDYYIAKGEKWTPKYQSFVDRMYGAIGEPLNGSSVTSLTIGKGSKSLTIEVEKSFSPGQPVRVYKDSANYMDGVVTSYDSVTGVMVVNVTSVLGSGTYATWSVGLIGSTVPVDKTINIISTAVNYPIVAGDLSLSGTIIEGDATLGNITVTLPTIAELNGKIVTVIADVDPAGNALITNKSTGTELHTSYAKGDFLAVTSNGVKYILLDERVTIEGKIAKTAYLVILAGTTVNPFNADMAVMSNVGGLFDAVTNFRLETTASYKVEINYGVVTDLYSKVSPNHNGTNLLTSTVKPTTGLFVIDMLAGEYIAPEVVNQTGTNGSFYGNVNKKESFFSWRVLGRIR